MKTTGLLCLHLLCVASLFGQQRRANAPADQKMGMAFTTTAIKALREAEAFPSALSGVPADAKPVTDDVQAAGDLARTEGEISAASLLHAFLADKAKNNAVRNRALTNAVDAWERYHPKPVPASEDASAQERYIASDSLEAYQRNASQAKAEFIRSLSTRRFFVELADGETACSVAFDRMLRAGTYRAVPECQSITVVADPDPRFT